MKAYKGFTKDMKCRDFQFEEGKTYEHNGEVKLCESGFHACENPIECLQHYDASSSVYREVELDGVSEDREYNSTKRVAKKITIGAELSIPALCKATYEYVHEHCTNEHNAEVGAATAGDRGAATAGDYGAATAGRYGAATAGDYGAATAGDRGAATAGDRGAATAGYSGAATAGDRGAATSRGTSSSGKNGLSVARGNNVKVRGGLGAILVIAEEDEDGYDIKEWKAVVVDGKKIKADTWYKLENGELIECE